MIFKPCVIYQQQEETSRFKWRRITIDTTGRSNERKL